MAMARNTALSAKIINVEPHPQATGRSIVTVEYDDGKGPWQIGYAIKNDPPPSLEAFIANLKERHHDGRITIERPKDPMRFLKESIDKPFEVNLTPPQNDPTTPQLHPPT